MRRSTCASASSSRRSVWSACSRRPTCGSSSAACRRASCRTATSACNSPAIWPRPGSSTRSARSTEHPTPPTSTAMRRRGRTSWAASSSVRSRPMRQDRIWGSASRAARARRRGRSRYPHSAAIARRVSSRCSAIAPTARRRTRCWRKGGGRGCRRRAICTSARWACSPSTYGRRTTCGERRAWRR